MVNGKLFSVIIPVYNCEMYLKRSIDSVLKQGYPLVEIILVDDGSSDASSIICDEYARKSNNCKVFHQDNQGIASARNYGLIQATGEYVCFLDADDYFEKDLLTRVACELEMGAEICSFCARRVDAKENFLYELHYEDGIGDYDFTNMDRQQFILNKFFNYQVGWEVCMSAFKKAFLTEHGIQFREHVKYGEDKVFFMECVSWARRMVKIPSVLYNYTQRNDSLTSTFKQENLVEQGNEEFCSVEHIWRKNGTINDDNDYIYYIGLMSFYYSILLKTRNYLEVKECFCSSKYSALQIKYFKKCSYNRRKILQTFGKNKGYEILRLIEEVMRD